MSEKNPRLIYSNYFGECLPMTIPYSILDNEKEFLNFVEKCIKENKLATEYFPYDKELIY